MSKFRDAMHAGQQQTRASRWSIVPKAFLFVAALVSAWTYQQNDRGTAIAIAVGALIVAFGAAVWINARAMRSQQK
ncbi:MAG TPA: hypothetical protein VEW69_04170 [Alphaproteobacteria bacterium]|nr:hypothetical protein [Alphaproteobacteria bacterium]